jgi:tight adherence protein C
MYLFIITLFITSFITISLLFSILALSPKQRLKLRITEHIPKDTSTIYDTPLLVRLFDPVIQWLSKLILKLTPIRYKQHLALKIRRVESKYNLQDILVLKLYLIFMLLACLSAYTWYVAFPNIILIIISLVVVYFLPDIVLNSVLKQRRQKVLMELPTFIDLLAVILEGGVSFDNAIRKICERKKGPIYAEFSRYIQDVNLGTNREEALKSVATRIKLPELDTLVRSIFQGEKMGVSILKTIQVQAGQLRVKRSQRIQEQAMKIPIKILFPLILFVFPPIFIIILGPGVIQILQNFMTR